MRETDLHNVANAFTIPVRRVPDSIVIEVYAYWLLDILLRTPRWHTQQVSSPCMLHHFLPRLMVHLWHDRVLLAPSSPPLMQYLVMDAGVAKVGILLPGVHVLRE